MNFSPDPVPLPPARLRYRVAGTDNEEWFDKSGQMSVADLARGLATVGKSLDDFENVLEWGCGCGRILRQLPPIENARRLYGNDIDQEAISWVKDNLPWVETSVTAGLPPLPYADGTFDLIYNHSVMTHLDEVYQDAWLAELSRLLRPGGVLTLTVSGPNAFQIFLDTLPTESPARTAYLDELYAKGIVFIAEDQWSRDFPEFYHTTFHDVGYVFDHWSAFLDVKCYIPRGSLDYQDMIVLQKPADRVVGSRTYQRFAREQRPALLADLDRSLVGARSERDGAQAALARLSDEFEAERARTKAALQLQQQIVDEQNEVRAEIMASLRVATESLRNVAQELSQHRAADISRLDATLEDLRREQATRADGALRRALDEVEHQRVRLEGIYASSSWLLTKPVRAIGRLLGRR